MITNSQIEPHSTFIFTVPQEYAKNRLDLYLSSLFTAYSRSFLQHIIEQGAVVVNQKTITKPSTHVSSNDTITVQFPGKKAIEPRTIESKTAGIEIIGQTQHFMVINKPAHLLTHATSSKNPAVSVVDWILHHHNELSSIGTIDRPGIIHRLDKETSGLLIITRTNHAHTVFGDLFKNRTIHKTYKAIVSGRPDKEGTISFAIGRDLASHIKMVSFNENFVDATGKIGSIKARHAKTHYKVLEYFDEAALIEVKPLTGRTHQIRVHMAALGHPIIGDQLYGKKSSLINRQALHAEQLSFVFEDTPYSFTNHVPEDFQQLITHLRNSSKK